MAQASVARGWCCTFFVVILKDTDWDGKAGRGLLASLPTDGLGARVPTRPIAPA
jgi:hypothetical protein